MIFLVSILSIFMPDDYTFISSICLSCGFTLGEFIPGMECPICGDPIL
tara:strand:+ start:569 stop:712 length:144 start_codon:yes stop_codon:yes gene_type:complete